MSISWDCFAPSQLKRSGKGLAASMASTHGRLQSLVFDSLTIWLLPQCRNLEAINLHPSKIMFNKIRTRRTPQPRISALEGNASKSRLEAALSPTETGHERMTCQSDVLRKMQPLSGLIARIWIMLA